MPRKYKESQRMRRAEQDDEEREHAQLRKELREELRRTWQEEEIRRPKLNLDDIQF